MQIARVLSLLVLTTIVGCDFSNTENSSTVKSDNMCLLDDGCYEFDKLHGVWLLNVEYKEEFYGSGLNRGHYKAHRIQSQTVFVEANSNNTLSVFPLCTDRSEYKVLGKEIREVDIGEFSVGLTNDNELTLALDNTSIPYEIISMDFKRVTSDLKSEIGFVNIEIPKSEGLEYNSPLPIDCYKFIHTVSTDKYFLYTGGSSNSANIDSLTLGLNIKDSNTDENSTLNTISLSANGTYYESLPPGHVSEFDKGIELYSKNGVILDINDDNASLHYTSFDSGVTDASFLADGVSGDISISIDTH